VLLVCAWGPVLCFVFVVFVVFFLLKKLFFTYLDLIHLFVCLCEVVQLWSSGGPIMDALSLIGPLVPNN
jgi:hypothetical protein